MTVIALSLSLLDNAVMAECLAYLLTWTTYGTWLRGDNRCWVDRRRNQCGTPYDQPEPARVALNRQRMQKPPVFLSPSYREAVEGAIRQSCQFKQWTLHAVSVRSNHVHVVVSATSIAPEAVQRTLKQYGSMAWNALHPSPQRKHWSTKDGSKRYLFTEEALQRAVAYVRDQ